MISSEMVNVSQDLGKMKCCYLSSEEKTDKYQEGGNWEGCRESRGCVGRDAERVGVCWEGCRESRGGVGTAVITASVIDDDFRYLHISQRFYTERKSSVRGVRNALC